MSATISYRLAAAIAVLAALLQIWMRMVGSEEDPNNLAFFVVVMTVLACAFTARFQAGGLARGMLASAVAEMLVGIAIATAPITAQVDPDAPIKVLGFSGAFAGLWLVSAALFHRSARGVVAMAV